MDRLKYIKLENEDGSYSSSIPLAVDSDHVDVNGSTLTNELNNKANTTNVNLSINNLQNQINSLASGSPLVASSTSDMTDTTRVYVLTTDGHWYWHDGSDWQDGGVYQAVGVAENDPIIKSIQSNIDDISISSHNLYNKADNEEDHTVITNTGAISTTTGNYTASGYIEVEANKILYIYIGGSPIVFHRICAYDSAKTFISGSYETSVSGSTGYSIPATAKYVRFDIATDKVSQNVMVSYIYLEPYQKYNEKFIKPTVRYVSSLGSDNNTGLTVDSPYLTIAKALSDNATKIYLASGTYPKLNITNVKVELVGNNAVFDANSSGSSLTAKNCDLKVSGCTFQNGSSNGVLIEDSIGKFTNCKAISNGSTGFRSDGSYVIYIDCIARENGIDGFNAHDTENGSSRGIFNNCQAIDNDDDGLSFHEQGSVVVNGGVFSGNGSGGITPFGQSDAKIYNAILKDNVHGVHCFNSTEARPSGDVVMFNCLISGNTYGITQNDDYTATSVNSVFTSNGTDLSGNVTILKS